jgi:TetR/AcrR family transcriptional regulator, transcriptional repressor for nem operon
MEVATNIFLEKGFGATSLRSIAKEAEVDIYNVQYYFKNKENLLSAIIESFVSAYQEKLQAICEDKSKPPEQRFQDLYQMQTYQERGSQLRTLYTQHLALVETNEHALQIMITTFTNYRALVAELVKELNPSLTLRETLRRADLVVVFLEGYCIYAAHWLPTLQEHKGLDKEAYRHLMNVIQA